GAADGFLLVAKEGLQRGDGAARVHLAECVHRGDAQRGGALLHQQASLGASDLHELLDRLRSTELAERGDHRHLDATVVLTVERTDERVDRSAVRRYVDRVQALHRGSAHSVARYGGRATVTELGQRTRGRRAHTIVL